MCDNSSFFHKAPVRDYDYSEFFTPVHYNGNVLTESERLDFVNMANDSISQMSEGLPLIHEYIEISAKTNNEITQTICSVWLFVTMTMIDCMVIGKYFILADRDYDRRFMRGKMMVILNEGFKRLYGFEGSTKKKSEWRKLQTILDSFPEIIQDQYKLLTDKLESHSTASSWWREERNIETHLDTESMYKSRQDELIESKVMIDSLALYNTLLAASKFLGNAHACIYNGLLDSISV